MFKVIFSKDYLRFSIIDPFIGSLKQYEELLFQLIVAFIILTATWLVAKIVQLIIKYILRLLRFDKLSDKIGFTKFLEHSVIHTIPSTTIYSFFYWIIIFI